MLKRGSGLKLIRSFAKIRKYWTQVDLVSLERLGDNKIVEPRVLRMCLKAATFIHGRAFATRTSTVHIRVKRRLILTTLNIIAGIHRVCIFEIRRDKYSYNFWKLYASAESNRRSRVACEKLAVIITFIIYRSLNLYLANSKVSKAAKRT